MCPPGHAAALVGGGIAMKSKWDVLEDVAEGRLVHVLPGWGIGEREIRAVTLRSIASRDRWSV